MVELQAQPWASLSRAYRVLALLFGRFWKCIRNMSYAVEGFPHPADVVDLSRLRSLTGVLSVMACLQHLCEFGRRNCYHRLCSTWGFV
jgi:hypothetical protein